MRVSLLKLQNNKSACVVAFHGGAGFSHKLERLGVRIGSRVMKVSHTSGPVIVKAGQTHLAIGRGMAAKIIVEEE